MISARRAGSADAAELARLRTAARAELAERAWGERYADDLEAMGSSTPADEFVVCVGTAVVGYATVRVEGDVALVAELYVEAGARRIGAGDVLVGALGDAAVERGCTWLESVALPGDRATKNFFEAHGMVSRLLRVSRRLS